MSRNAKIVTVMIGALLVVCLCGAVATFGVLGSLGAVFARTLQFNPGEVDAAASRIADFQLPSGYRSDVTMDLGGYMFVSYSSGNGHSHIMFVQAPASANLDQAVLEQYLQQAAQSRGYDRRTRSQVVGQVQATIRGQTVPLVVQEGTNSNGEAYRSLTGVFNGKGGPALISVEAPLSRWNQAEVDVFLATIR